MNTTLRNLIVALPLATAALTMAPGAAMADDGQIVLPPPSGDPQGPIITNPTPDPVDPVDPTGPGDLTAPQPCPTHGDCGGNGGEDGDGGNGDEPDVHNGGGLYPQDEVDSIALPTRIDAGLAPVQQQDGSNGLELSWLLASGVLVTASGAAFAARRVRAHA